MGNRIKRSIFKKLSGRIKRLIKSSSVIGSGKWRVVYDISHDKVLKVAKRPKGIKCNKKEGRIYKKASSSVKKHLAKVFDHGRGWIIMKKVDTPFPDSKKYKKRLLKLKRKFKKHGIKPIDITRNRKPKADNLRLRNRRIIVIDYGNFKLKRKK
ncbi:hypothetical protein [Ammoniphilus resinae]|uniref:Transposase n=1 Tax=Ammoniphilus resinae TaxID=861532 RepID=A0ABS4GVY8_9BACL|nr:hypothetical protein [Ammoniphilus resinae]MBP1934445.1 hypothetical protein [Ammoniphilus resinae]